MLKKTELGVPPKLSIKNGRFTFSVGLVRAMKLEHNSQIQIAVKTLKDESTILIRKKESEDSFRVHKNGSGQMLFNCKQLGNIEHFKEEMLLIGQEDDWFIFK